MPAPGQPLELKVAVAVLGLQRPPDSLEMPGLALSPSPLALELVRLPLRLVVEVFLDRVNLAVEVRGSEGFEASALVDGEKHAASVVGARGVQRVRRRVSSSNSSSNTRLRRE